ncbi:MAG: type IVB secretion system protein IcmM/DotJ [Gammaproteobacteria bacterium]|nr:type IVB secretion system protein IcmM/DotJ [Gammaproteobacteria bacterium]
MGVKTWDLIKRSKQFYVKTYRGAETATVLSVLLNLALGLGIFYAYSTRSEPDYYSTYGETPPVLLTAMGAPNYSSHPLLADNGTHDGNVKEIPQ